MAKKAISELSIRGVIKAMTRLEQQVIAHTTLSKSDKAVMLKFLEKWKRAGTQSCEPLIEGDLENSSHTIIKNLKNK